MTPQQILAALPYSKPFLFVDELVSLSPDQAVGHYTYRPNEFFYAGHFVGKPVTPGVILLETMAQIGGVALGFYLLGDAMHTHQPLFSHIENAEFYGAVLPNTKVMVHSTKKYFRRNTLKTDVEMTNEQGETLCIATISCKFVEK